MKECIIIGGGSSVKEGIELGLWDKIKNKETWSLNSCFKMMPYNPSIQMWVDRSFFTKEKLNILSLKYLGTKLVCKNYEGFYDNLPIDDKYLTNRHVENCGETVKLFVGRLGLSGMFALSYAKLMKYDRIYLLGMDFGTPEKDNKATHWYSGDVQKYNIYSHGVGNPGVYYDSSGNLKAALMDFCYYNEINDKIFNVSLTSNISQFTKISYNEFFDMIKGGVYGEE